MTQGELVKAEISFKDNPARKTVCMFNPTEYTISKTNAWEIVPVPHKNVGHPVFKGGQPSTLTLNLLFDTLEANTHAQVNSRAGSDVREHTKVLWDLMKIDESQNSTRPEPPHCVFKWGTVWGFEAVITNLEQTFILFRADGTPLRAKVRVSFTQISEEAQYPRQNPTSGGQRGPRVRVIHENETLAGIAYEEYGDTSAWRHLATINNIQDPRRLQPGSTLIITPLEA